MQFLGLSLVLMNLIVLRRTGHVSYRMSLTEIFLIFSQDYTEATGFEEDDHRSKVQSSSHNITVKTFIFSALLYFIV